MRPPDKVLGGRSQVKVAVVQTPPVFFDREKCIERACAKIAEAAAQGAELIAFTIARASEPAAPLPPGRSDPEAMPGTNHYDR